MNRRSRIPLLAALLACGIVLILRRQDVAGDAEPAEASTASSPTAAPKAEVRMSGGDPGSGTNRPGTTVPPRPPDPNLHFRDLTPEQRVRIARMPNGVGG